MYHIFSIRSSIDGRLGCFHVWAIVKSVAVNVAHIFLNYGFLKGFPHSSIGKESTCNAGDPGLIPGSERSAGEGIGYPLQ